MEELFTEYGDWTWWVIALVLATLELIVPGVLLIWLSGAALLVALVDLVIDIPWQAEVALFAVFSVAFAYAGYRVSRQPSEPTDNPNLNRRSQSYVGRVFEVEEAIVNGRGKVHVGDTLWQASGPDTPAGARVRVVGVDGTILIVEPD